jgi:hypothetical protein
VEICESVKETPIYARLQHESSIDLMPWYKGLHVRNIHNIDTLLYIRPMNVALSRYAVEAVRDKIDTSRI